MAQFNYKDYEAAHSNKGGAKQGGGNLPKTHFVNEYLKNDGDSVVVRFPYHSMDDILFESTHLVKGVFPGDKFGKRVRCSGNDCPLCDEGVKTDVRVFVKAICYISNGNGGVDLVPAVWDRPAAFADIDLKNLMAEYGDLTENLFKIKRNGMKLDTTYTTSIILNKTVYNPEIYKVDFSSLDAVDPVKILTKSMEQYNQALNPSAATETSQSTSNVEQTASVAETTTSQESMQSTYQAETSQVEAKEVPQTKTSEAPVRKRFTF